MTNWKTPKDYIQEKKERILVNTGSYIFIATGLIDYGYNEVFWITDNGLHPAYNTNRWIDINLINEIIK